MTSGLLTPFKEKGGEGVGGNFVVEGGRADRKQIS